MEYNLSNAKRFVHTAQTALKRADREYAYYKNGSPYPEGSVPNDTPQYHYLESQKSYREAKNYAERALEVLKVVKDAELEREARAILAKCNRNK